MKIVIEEVDNGVITDSCGDACVWNNTRGMTRFLMTVVTYGDRVMPKVCDS